MSRATTDTIVAVSSPPGRSYRGLVRIAGPDAARVAGALLAPSFAGDTDEFLSAPRRLLPAVLRSPRIPCLVAWFAGPRSYTGDDLFELQVPGSAALLDRLLHDAVAHGARLAEPGEFSFRAYVNGRMGLTEAEGVAATIEAVSDAQLAAARTLRDGRLASQTRGLVDELGTSLALVEAGIDFVDQEDVVPIPAQALAESLDRLLAQVGRLVDRSRTWGELEALPRVVLVGPPSTGKSTVFNRLLGHDRAVIHAMPGTTRDVLAEPLSVEDAAQPGVTFEVMLVDIAGLDTAEALLDRAAQTAAQREIARADLLIVFGKTRFDTGGMPVLRVAPKADTAGGGEAPDGLPISGVTGQGLKELRGQIAGALGTRAVGGDGLALQPRHEAALRDAREHLRLARQTLGDAAGPVPDVELVAGRMRGALDALAGLGGELTPDDVIGKVFAAFCVGK